MPDDQKTAKMDASEYYKLRLEHTIQHLQQATRLIYLVGGAVVAMFYFVIDKMSTVPSHRTLAGMLLLLLCAVNVVHALFIREQATWYSRFDKALAESIGAKEIGRENEGAWLTSRWLWAMVHWLVAIAALLFGLFFLFCY